MNKRYSADVLPDTKVVASNSTNTPLDSGSTFTGEWVERDASELIFVGSSDKDYTFIAQFSTDKVNVDSALTYTYIAGEVNTPKRLIISRAYYRILITNSSGENQTYLRFETSTGSFQALTTRLDSTITLDADSTITKAVVAGLNPSGVYKSVTVNSSNALQVNDYMFGVATEDFSNVEINTKFGSNQDIDIGTAPEDVWSGGGNYTGQPIHSASAETVQVFSSSTSDTSAGSGARTVRLSGLDTDFLEITEDVTLNGTTAVTTTNTWKRLNSVKVLTGGSGGANVGEITCRHSTTTANVFAKLAVGANQSTVAAFTVPAGKTMYIVRFRAALSRTNGSAGSATYSLRVREEAGVYRGVRRANFTTNYPVDYTLKGAIVIVEKSDVKVRIEAVSDNNSAVSAAFEYLLVDN